MAASSLQFKPFSEGDDIECFLERIDQYFAANSVEKDLQVSTLITLLEEKTYKILKGILHPDLPKNKSYTELEAALKLRFKPRVSYYRKRTVFDKLQQLEEEAVTSWYSRVREAAAECNFGNSIDERVRDKFVTGMRMGPVYERLCEEAVTKKTTDLLDIALNKESVLQERKAVNKVHRVYDAKKVLLGAKGAVNFIDDVLVTGANDQEHLQNLKEVLQRFKDVGIRLNKSKCLFFQNEIKYLGHIISKEGLKKDKDKLEGVVKAPPPTNVTEVRSWIGMVNYYSKFIPHISLKLKPLYDLLQKNIKFVWSKECNNCFEDLKKEIISDKILIHFDSKLPLRLACDASQNGIGAVLSHIMPDGSDRPISFISRVYTKAEKGYSMIHKEALAIYWAVQKFYQYLVGTKFELQSDHKPLQALFGENKSLPQMAAGRLQRWSLYLAGFDYTFKHIKGIENVKADCMSRLPINNNESDNVNKKEYDYINFVEQQNVIDLNLVRSETRKDPILSSVYNMIRYGFPNNITNESLRPFIQKRNELYIEQNVIMWGYRVIIPSKLQINLLKELHSTHEGIVKMKSNARSYFWWPGLDNHIENFVKACDICMSARPEPQKAQYISWPKTHSPYERVHADFLGPLDNKIILIIIDTYSKWPEAYIMKSTDSRQTIEKFRECFSRYGLPKIVVTDNAATFCSQEFSEFLSKNGIKHETSPPFHPATNGIAENAVKSFKSAISKALRDKVNKTVSFETLINRYLFHYRNSIHAVTGVTPSQLMFQRKLRTRLDLLSTNDKDKDRQKCIKEGRKEIFKEGDIVYCRDYRNPNKKKFVKAEIDEVLGERTYLCKIVNENLIWKRHLDQIVSSSSQEQNNYDEAHIPNFVSPNTVTYSNDIITQPNNVTHTENVQTPKKILDDNVIIINSSPGLINPETLPQIENNIMNKSKNNLSTDDGSESIRRSNRIRKAPQRLDL